MRLSTLFLIVLTTAPALSVHGQCMVCPDGPDSSAAGTPACTNLDTRYKNITFAEECAGIQMAFMPSCCPSQLATIAKDNACGWCTNGVSEFDAVVELPFSTESVTCGALMFGILGTQVDPDVCTFYNSIAPICCPNGEEFARCDFCPFGMDHPDVVLPSSDGSSCQDIKRYADLVFEGEMCENSLKPVETVCCPSTTDNFVCDYCSGGLEFPDNMLDDSIQCSELTLFSKLANETQCEDIKISEALCCPSSTTNSLPPVTEGDYCYLCGSAEVEMKRPEYQPFALGDSVMTEDDLMTCAQIEQDMNDDRQPGSSCMNAVGSFTLFFSPSICGCGGFEPPNACDICNGGTVNRAAMAPGQNFTCGEGIDFLKHTSAAFCASAEDVDLDEINAACCIYDDADADDGDGATNNSGAEIYGQCVTCPGGIEFPDATPNNSNGLTCSTIDTAYASVDEASCKQFQYITMPACCPSQIPFIAQGNACGWCPNGVTNLQGQVDLSAFQSDIVSCGEMMTVVASRDDQPGVCDIAQSTAEICCPGDSGGTGFDCEFCTMGVEFPDLVVPEAENLTCFQIEAAAKIANETICSTLVQPIEGECCPNSVIAPTDPPVTAMPAPTDMPVTMPTDFPIPTDPPCVFCPLGIETEEIDLSFLDILGLPIPGGLLGNFTCSDLQLSAALSPSLACDDDIILFENFCCPSTSGGYQCNWCPGDLGMEFPDRQVPLLGLDLPALTCTDILSFIPAVTTKETCSDYQTAESICCPTTVGAVQCDFCSGPGGLEFPDQSIDDSGLTCTDFASFALGAPNEDFCQNIEAAQGLCCPASSGVSLPPVAEGEYCYICGNADVVMTKPDYQPYAFGGAEDPDDLVTCAEIEALINEERGSEESCGSAIASFTFLFSPSICGCAGVEPPNVCGFCEGKSVKRDVVLPEENVTCGDAYDFVQHFTSSIACDGANTEFGEAERICCGDELEQGGGDGGSESAARSSGAGLFFVYASFVVGFVLP
ncbi:unnamed protein product [Cylindrotheca closterium]|uniref:Subtilisin n=1 Tax=Cylindrotheca closterium TaxID=2856 RepID=A0AAD2G8Z8_9STRA|nr:unnamed protein product [Cylindrotheca closterium]